MEFLYCTGCIIFRVNQLATDNGTVVINVNKEKNSQVNSYVQFTNEKLLELISKQPMGHYQTPAIVCNRPKQVIYQRCIY